MFSERNFSGIGLLALVFISICLIILHKTNADVAGGPCCDYYNWEKMEEDLRQGNGVCVWDHQYNMWAVKPLCEAKCGGYKIAEDQGECFAEFCKKDTYQYRCFCAQIGDYHIKKEECDTKARSGEAKYRGAAMHCRLSWKKKNETA